jgi:geranylgeranylglycerol-phosphate geranylgeranyltransferase
MTTGDRTVAVPAPPGRSPLRAWTRLLRLHFAPLSLSAGLVGLVAGGDSPSVVSAALAVVICTTGYSVGTMLNDFTDMEADAINAPDRPFVSGEIDPKVALSLLAVSVVGLAIVSLLLATAVAIWAIIALAGHFVYTLAKPIPWLGPLANGGDLALFTLVGAAAAEPDRSWPHLPGAAWIVTGLVALLLSGFCLTGYFKDLPGDRVAGYRTLPVVLGPRRARWFVPPFPLAAIAIAVVLLAAHPSAFDVHGPNAAFWVLAAIACVEFGVSVSTLFRGLTESAYEALVWYTRGCVVFTLALGALYEPALFLGLTPVLAGFLELAMRQTGRFRQA